MGKKMRVGLTALTFFLGCSFSGMQCLAADNFKFDCQYNVGVAADALTGNSDIEVDVRRDENLKLVVDLQRDANTGFMNGDLGSSGVRAVRGTNKITFFNTLEDATVQMITVFGKESGTFGSVISRGINSKALDVPSQYFGTCAVKQN